MDLHKPFVYKGVVINNITPKLSEEELRRRATMIVEGAEAIKKKYAKQKDKDKTA